MSKLKSCPFCGGNEISMGAFSLSDECYIRCENCGVSFESEVEWGDLTEKEHDKKCSVVLVKAWNTRHIPMTHRTVE